MQGWRGMIIDTQHTNNLSAEGVLTSFLCTVCSNKNHVSSILLMHVIHSASLSIRNSIEMNQYVNLILHGVLNFGLMLSL